MDKANAASSPEQISRADYERILPKIKQSREIQQLMDQGVITQAQFEAARKREAREWKN
jgi:hypothetical protein